MTDRIQFDPATAKWFGNHLNEETTLAKCECCSLYYKPELGHKCKSKPDAVSPLIPCPFCGSPAELRLTHRVPSGFNYTPRCTVTSCAGRLAKLWMNKEEAIAAWNRRANDANQKADH